METEEERRARLENDSYKMAQFGHVDGGRKKARLKKTVATKRLKLAMETDKKRKNGENGRYHTAQIGLGDGGRKKSKKWIRFNLD